MAHREATTERVDAQPAESAASGAAARAAPSTGVPGEVLALQRAAGNRAVGSALMRESGKGENRHATKAHEKLRKKLAGGDKAEYVGRLLDALAERSFRGLSLSKTFPRIVDALLNLRRLAGSKQEVEKLYADEMRVRPRRMVTSEGEWVSLAADLDTELRRACSAQSRENDAYRALKAILSDARMSRVDELRLSLGLLTHSSIGAGDHKLALERLHETEWTPEEIKQIRGDSRIKKAFGKSSVSEKFFKSWVEMQDVGTKTAADARDIRVRNLAARLRPLVYDTAHEFWRGHQGTTQFAAMADLIKEWIKANDAATRERAAQVDGPVHELLYKYRHRHAGHTVAKWDADYLMSLLTKSFVQQGTTLTDTGRQDRRVGEFISMLTREREKYKHNPLAKAVADSGKLIDAAYALSPSGAKEVLDHFAKGPGNTVLAEPQALKALGASLKEAGLDPATHAVIVARFRVRAVKRPGARFRRLVKKVTKALHDDDRALKLSSDAMSILTKMSPEELAAVRADNDLVAALEGALRFQPGGGQAVKQLLGHAGARADAYTEADITARADAIKADPVYWARLVTYEFRKHFAGEAVLGIVGAGKVGRAADRRAVNAQKLAGVVQRAIWALTDAKVASSKVITALPDDVVEQFLAKEPRLYYALARGEDVPAEYRLKIARRGIKTHDDEIAAMLEETPDERVLAQWSNVDQLYALFIKKKQAAAARDQKKWEDAVRAIDDFLIDIKPSAHELIFKELRSRFGKHSRLVKAENAIRTRIANALGKDATFNQLVMDNALSPMDRRLMRERLLALATIREEDLARHGVQHGLLWRKLDVLAAERKVRFAMVTHEQRDVRDALTKGTGRFLEQGEGWSPARDEILRGRLRRMRDTRTSYEAVRTEWLKARTKFNTVIKTIVHIVLASLVTGLTGGIAGPTTFAAAVIISLVNSAVGVALKGIDFAVDAALEGGADVTFNETVRGIVRHVLIEPGIKAAVAAATFGLRDVMPSVTVPGKSMRQVWQYEPTTEMKGTAEEIGELTFGDKLLGMTDKEKMAFQAKRVFEMAGYRMMESAMQKAISDVGGGVFDSIEDLVDRGKPAAMPRIKGMVGGYLNTMMTEFAMQLGYGGVILPAWGWMNADLAESWTETPMQPDPEKGERLPTLAEALTPGDADSDTAAWTGWMKSEVFTTLIAEAKTALEEGVPDVEGAESGSGSRTTLDKGTAGELLRRLRQAHRKHAGALEALRAPGSGAQAQQAPALMKALKARVWQLEVIIREVEKRARVGRAATDDPALVRARQGLRGVQKAHLPRQVRQVTGRGP